jgi:hypothetical protein
MQSIVSSLRREPSGCPDNPEGQLLRSHGVRMHLAGLALVASCGGVGFEAPPSEDAVAVDADNDLACAGHTATGFPAPCTADARGDYRAANPGGPALFFNAQDGTSLTAALSTIAGSVCCGCLL